MLSLRRLLLLVYLAGCAATSEPPLRAPEIEARVTYHAGDPIGGTPGLSEVETLALRAGDTLAVRGRLYVLDERPGERFEPLADRVRLIVGEGGAEPLAPRSLLFTGARLTTGAEAAELARDVAARRPQEAVLSAAFDGLVLPGVTTTLSAAHAQAIELAGHLPAERRFSVELWREDAAGDAVSVALVLSDVVEVVEDIGEANPVVARRPRRERLVLDARIEGPAGPVAVFAPAAFDPSGRLAYVLVLEAITPDEDERAALPGRLAEVLAEVRSAATLGADRRAPLELADRLHVRRLGALDALTDATYRRAAIVTLSGNAPIAGEFALACDEATVADLCGRLVERSAELRARASDETALAWELERETLSLLAELRTDADLAPEHAALLLRHAGEAGRHAGALEDALAASASLADFYARILEENRIALEDASPSARVRAHDWLAAQGLQVPGYDPLADGRARRAALRAWADAEVTDAAAGAGADVR